MQESSFLGKMDTRVGVLGAGQLGKMMAIAAGNWHLPLHFLDKSPDMPAVRFGAAFTEGDFQSYEDVYRFGKTVDILTIEIEHVNIAALKQLEAEGLPVYPAPAVLEMIKDKGLQKTFYRLESLPTAPFRLCEDAAAIRECLERGDLALPFVQKSRSEGYDGKGVQVIRTAADLDKLMDTPSVIEHLVDIDKELAVIIARTPSGAIKVYPPVEMSFHPEANLVEFLLCPARIAPEVAIAAEALAVKLAEAMKITGLLAVELFLDKKGNLLINEVAPRPHNSGHHTIESCPTSQFEQHLRAILNWPLGDTALRVPAAAMINVLGAAGASGETDYEGLDLVMQTPGASVHLYGKISVKPFRKMGHITLTADSLEDVIIKARSVEGKLQAVAKKY